MMDEALWLQTERYIRKHKVNRAALIRALLRNHTKDINNTLPVGIDQEVQRPGQWAKPEGPRPRKAGF